MRPIVSASKQSNQLLTSHTALMTGNAGKAGAGLMPIRGHSNVQGFGSMGVTARLKAEIREALEALLGRSLKREPGYDARALIEASDRGQVDTLLCLGGNLYAANPNLRQAKRALGQIDTIFYLSTKPNLGHFHGLAKRNTIIVPVYARFENPHKTTTESGNNFVRLNDEGKTHLTDADLISEVEFLTELAHRIHGDRPVNWRQLKNTRYVRQLIARTKAIKVQPAAGLSKKVIKHAQQGLWLFESVNFSAIPIDSPNLPGFFPVGSRRTEILKLYESVLNGTGLRLQ